jgi:hypothetical protein
MPVFIVKEGRHFVSYITGPSHILLGLRFANEPVEPKLVKQPPQGSCLHGSLDDSQIFEAVQEVLTAHRAEGASVFAAEIVYVENDSPRYDLYRLAAHLLTKQFLTGGEFKHVP